LGYFKEVEKHAFTLSQCWLKLKDYGKWKTRFVLWFKDGKWTAEDNEQETPGESGAHAKRPRGRRASKTDLHHEASALALGNTLKSVFANKEEGSFKRDEQRRQDKEEHMQSFADIQRKTLEVQQRKLDLADVKERARAKELELKAKDAEESKIMMADLSALDLARRAWFESKKAMIRSRDACIRICCCYFWWP
jgi:hypothetical protein